MALPEIHVFVCLNKRDEPDPRGDCASKGSVEVHAMLKDMVKAKGLKTRVRVNKAGCLDQCHLGTTIVVYPEGTWYGHVTKEDVPRIVEEHLIGGKPVEGLLIR